MTNVTQQKRALPWGQNNSSERQRMSLPSAAQRTFASELRSVLATLHCLSEYASEQGDKQCAAILHNAAALLELSVPTPAPQASALPQALRYEHASVAFA